MYSLLASFLGGFLLGFSITTGIDLLAWGGLVSLLLAILLHWCEKQEG